MTAAGHEQRLYELWGEIRDLTAADAVLSWDQETYMPPKGQAGRGRALATLAGLKHEKLTAPELGEAIEGCLAVAAPDSELAAQAREALRQRQRAVRVPAALAKAIAALTSDALASWQEARRRSDFLLFQPKLEQLVRLRREQAAAIDGSRPAYDVLMDEFEPGATEADLAPVFAELQRGLAPLIQEVAGSGRVVDETPAHGRFPGAAQREFGLFLARAIGFDFAAGRLDETTHPFCSGFNVGDVRLTWRWQEDDFRPALFGILHEAGHGLYEQGLPAEWEGKPLGAAISLGVHESQSRLWENLVGRSRAFWRWALPHFQRAFPGRREVTVERLWPALHTARPSLIRVEADEATYNLHVAARFDLERALFGGGLEVADLPGAWSDAYQRLLGVRPAGDAEGVLQDIHWSMGMFGYFPTYTLGNLINAQLMERARAELGDLDAAFARGEFQPLRDWLRAKIHRHGARHSAAELVRLATGRPLSSAAFLRYIRAVTGEAYGLKLAV